ncbi:ATP-dependent DNA helicase [Neptuniibacter sp. QD37_11]|uniref:ATP-dependent DNA helicase n=1 Tax=Neptuniibacter sp. QD37_11 TaxID=3398209 RepID=UPI0039F47516
MTWQSRLRELVDYAFHKDGWLVSRGFNHVPEQASYAKHVVNWLCHARPVSLLEGDTGTGKSLGFSIPLLAYAAITDERVAVATFTNALQHQLIDSDIPVAVEFVKETLDVNLDTALRVGRHQYFAPSRIELLIEERFPTGLMPEEWTFFNEWVKRSVSSGTGLVSDWIAEHGALPDNIHSQDVCLLQHHKEYENPQYTNDREDCQSAQVIVCSISSLLLEQLRGQTAEFGAIVVDEADRIETAAQAIMNKRLQPYHIHKLAERLIKNTDGALRFSSKQLSDCALSMHERLSDLKTHWSNSRHVTFDESADGIEAKGLIKEELKKLLSQLKSVNKLAGKSKVQNSDLPRLVELKEIESWVQRFCSERGDEGEMARAGLSWSPIKSLPSLSTIRLDPGRIISRLWHQHDVPVMMTSATLSDGHADIPTFNNLCRMVGLYPDNIAESVQISPKSFGKMKFALSPLNNPLPFVKDEEVGAILSDIWVKNTCDIINAASENSSHTLVITGSFREAQTLGKQLTAIGNTPVIVHHANRRLDECLIAFKEAPSAVLISPSVWEGVSIRSLNGDQLFKNLVITRLPNSTPDFEYEETFVDNLMRRGYSFEKASGAFQAAMHHAMVRKLRQGIGRLLRSKSDEGTLWVCDSRFTTSVKALPKIKGASKAVPLRFHEELKCAEIFTSNGMLEAMKPKHTKQELEAMIV